MAFTWVQSVSVGSGVTKAVIDEIRTNVDWIDNNRACWANDSGNDSGLQSYCSYCGSNYGANNK